MKKIKFDPMWLEAWFDRLEDAFAIVLWGSIGVSFAGVCIFGFLTEAILRQICGVVVITYLIIGGVAALLVRRDQQ